MDRSALNSGLYDGDVKGRRLYDSTQVKGWTQVNNCTVLIRHALLESGGSVEIKTQDPLTTLKKKSYFVLNIDVFGGFRFAWINYQIVEY